MPDTQRSELDGIPFIGPVLTSHLSTRESKQENVQLIEWEYYGMRDNVMGTLSYSISDEFSRGGKDEYVFIAEND